jgi:hypothetical protein
MTILTLRCFIFSIIFHKKGSDFNLLPFCSSGG